MTRLALLELIADKAEQLLDLERDVVRAKDPRRMMDDLKAVRFELRELLRALKALDRG